MILSPCHEGTEQWLILNSGVWVGQFFFVVTVVPQKGEKNQVEKRQNEDFIWIFLQDDDSYDWLTLINCLPCASTGLSTFLYVHAAAKSLQSCPTLCFPTDHSPPGSSIRGILQARLLE